MKSIVLILMTIFLIRCENSFTNKKKSKLPNPPRNLVTYYFWIGCGSSMKLIADTFLEDQKNGTYLVKRNSGYTYSAPGCTGLSSVTTENLYYVKKCLQGQVYRTAENDCKGTGSATNSWGAQKFQWCQTADRSCDLPVFNSNGNIARYVVDPTKSPAAISCANDKTVNKSWSILEGLTNESDELWHFPEGTTKVPLWSVHAHLSKIDIAYLRFNGVNSSSDNSYGDKTLFQSVLCIAN